MATTPRTRFRKTKDSTINAGAQDTSDFSEIIPAGESWSLERITVSDFGKGNLEAGQFRVRYGKPGDWEVLMIAAALAGSYEKCFKFRQLVGDGTKELDVKRENISGTNRRMVVEIEGLKRL